LTRGGFHRQEKGNPDHWGRKVDKDLHKKKKKLRRSACSRKKKGGRAGKVTLVGDTKTETKSVEGCPEWIGEEKKESQEKEQKKLKRLGKAQQPGGASQIKSGR